MTHMLPSLSATEARTLPSGVREANTLAELQAIRRLRYEVYVSEEGKVLAAADHQTRELGDSHDATAIHLYIAEGDEVVACVRVHAGFIPEGLSGPLELNRFPACGRGQDCFVSKLMVRKDHRGTMATARLMKAILAVATGSGLKTIFCTTFPHLVALYERIGMVSYRGMYMDKDFGPHYALVALVESLGLRSSKPRVFGQAA